MAGTRQQRAGAEGEVRNRPSYGSSSQKRREGRARVRTGVGGALKKDESLEHKNSDGTKLMRCGAGRKERVGHRETGTWKHASPCAKQTGSGSLLCDVGLCAKPGRWAGEGTQPNLWLIRVAVWQKPAQHCSDHPSTKGE